MKGDPLTNPFTSHPASVGESYGEHCGAAAGFGFRLVAAGLACIAHALLPFIFTHSGSNAVERLHAEMSARRSGERG